MGYQACQVVRYTGTEYFTVYDVVAPSPTEESPSERDETVCGAVSETKDSARTSFQTALQAALKKRVFGGFISNFFADRAVAVGKGPTIAEAKPDKGMWSSLVAFVMGNAEAETK